MKPWGVKEKDIDKPNNFFGIWGGFLNITEVQIPNLNPMDINESRIFKISLEKHKS